MADANGLVAGFYAMGPGNTSIGFDLIDLKNATPNALAVGWVFAARKADTITHVGFRQGVTTGTPASGSYKITLKSVGSTGNPNADVGSTATTFQPTSGNDSSFVWVQLANAYTCTRGEMLAITLENNADTSSNGITVTQRSSNVTPAGAGLPYDNTYASSTWSRGNNSSRNAVYGYKSASAVYGFPVSGSTNRTVNTSGQRSAMKFTLPAGMGTSFTIQAVRGVLRWPAGSGSYILGIWNAAGTSLQSITIDSDYTRSAGGLVFVDAPFADSTLATLLFGTAYYIGLESVSSTQVGMLTMDLTSSNDLLAHPGADKFIYSSWNGSAWTDVATARPFVELIFDDITVPSGGLAMPVSGSIVA